MNPLIKRLAHEASAPLEDMLSRLIKTAAFVILAVGCAIAASVFLTMDLYLFIEERAGTLIAAASVAGLYLVGAVIFLLLALRRPHRAPAATSGMGAPAIAAPVTAASLGANAAPAQPRDPAAFAARIDTSVAPVLNILRDAGLNKEARAIEAATQIAKQVNPVAFLALTVGAGVMLGRTLRARRTLF